MNLGDAREAGRRYVLHLLNQHVTDRRLREGIEHLLSLPSLILSDAPQSLLVYGTLECYELVTQHSPDEAIPAAVALDLVFAGIEFIDKALDQEGVGSQETFEAPSGVNIGYCLQSLATIALVDLHTRGFPWPKVMTAQQELANIVVETTKAQELDLHYETIPQTSFAEALEVTTYKGAPLVSGIARLGARLGSDAPQLVDPLISFGWNAGAFAQLANDLTDSGPGSEHKSDIRQRKKTLPLVYIIHHSGDKFAQERAWLTSSEMITSEQEKRIREASVTSGGRDFTATIAEIHRSRARKALMTLPAQLDTRGLAAAFLGD